MTLEIGRRLLSSGAATGDQVQDALYAHVVHDVPFLRALVQHGVEPDAIESEVERSDAPRLRNVAPAFDLIRPLPPGLCERLLAVPVRADPITATVDVAVADPFDAHAQREFSFHLNAPVRVVQAPLHAVEAALVQVAQELEPAFPTRRRSRTPMFGSAAPRFALPMRKASSEIPIPLVRKSRPSNPPPLDPTLDDADDPGRITQDAVVLDPGSLPAARPSHGALWSSSAAGVDTDSFDIKIPKHPAVPDIETPPETSPLLTEAVVGVERALEEIDCAPTRDEVVLATLRGMAAVARRVGVFAVRRDAFTGWACTRSFANEDVFRGVRIDRRDDTVFAHAAAEGWYVGLIPRTDAHGQLLSLVPDPDGEVAVIAVRLLGRAAMLILAAQMVDTLIATRTAERLAQASAKALIRVLRAEKRQDR